MGTVRSLKDDEKALLIALIVGKPQGAQLLGSLVSARVEEMNDGGMGSLRFCASDERPRRLGMQLVEKEFIDSDGIPIMVAINLDEHGDLYELDIWKVDFSPLKQFPKLAQ
ncbi:hypothetical protein VSR34_22765 [Paraburkholderia sp. JHI2823]|uniref:DUF6984 family protein n=1 Tax=Paraburkholderia TaxID=1822464 RepID=UPI00056865B1|nr:hypothetical protein [Paraburkholderia mimosarum]